MQVHCDIFIKLILIGYVFQACPTHLTKQLIQTILEPIQKRQT